MDPVTTVVWGPLFVNIMTCCCVDFWNCLKEKVGVMCKLKDNLDLLRTALADLKERRIEVENKVKTGELKGEQPRAIVTDWLSQVQAIESNANRLIADASGQDVSSQGVSSNDASSHDASSQGVSSSDASAVVHQRLSTSGCCWSMDNISNCSLGGKVLKTLTEVRDLTCKGNFETVTEQATLPVVNRKELEVTFGLETMLNNTWTSLMKNENRMLGIYGMGGIGKTTLLASINNKFDDGIVKAKFDVVIWVKVKDANIMKIQDRIGKRLGLYDEIWRNYTRKEKANHIDRVLTDIKDRFVLLLDGLWEKVSLTTIGIPLQGKESAEKKYKIVFTTRSKDVCAQMLTDEDIEVKCLEIKDALKFLKHKAGIGTLNDVMNGLAEEIAEACHRLPLALRVVRPLLSSRRSAKEWRGILHTLKSAPAGLGEMEKELFCVLELSLDHLEKKDAKLCFQYCALFPKAYNIKDDELVEYWIGEGIIHESSERDRETTKIRGMEIIYNLVGAGLLMKDAESKQKVYMHDMMRDMALRMVSKFKDGQRFLVKTDAGLKELPEVSDWTTATKMSLINNEIDGISDDPEFCGQARLQTLFLQNNKLVEIVGQFFDVMSTLVVLDLSQNPFLTKLPEEFSKLVRLRYLKLLGTMIKDLPSDFGKLDQLIHLDLESTISLQSISLISELSKLQVLKFYGSAAALDIPVLEKLRRMKGLEVLTITVKEVDVLEAFLGSTLPGKTHGLYLEGVQVSVASFAATFGILSNLCNLEMINCNIKESNTRWEDNQRRQLSPSTSSNPSNTLFENLSAVVLSSCQHLRDVSWLIYAVNLESLTITLSPKLEELITREKAAGVGIEPFQNLRVIDLDFLYELRSIYWSPVSFPRLHRLKIKECPKLHKLPLKSTSVDRIDDLRIEVEEAWLDSVEWEDGAKERFLPVIRTVSPVERH